MEGKKTPAWFSDGEGCVTSGADLLLWGFYLRGLKRRGVQSLIKGPAWKIWLDLCFFFYIGEKLNTLTIST